MCFDFDLVSKWFEENYMVLNADKCYFMCLGKDTENQLKALYEMMKMLFISPQKLFSFSRYLSFSLDFLVMYWNGLIKKIRLISNFMASQPG